MSHGDFRRDVRQAFEEMTGMPTGDFTHRVRSAVREAGSPRAPRTQWVLAAVAAALVLVVAGTFILMRGGLPTTTVPGGGTTPTPPLAAASPSPSPAASPAPTYPAYSYVCTDTQASQPVAAPQPDLVITGYTAVHSQPPSLPFEAAVVQYTGTVSGYKVQLLGSPTFTLQTGKGGQVTLQGSAGLELTLTGANVRPSGQAAVSPGFTVIQEVRELGGYEGYVSFGLGLSRPVCYAVVFSQNPNQVEVWIQP